MRQFKLCSFTRTMTPGILGMKLQNSLSSFKDPGKIIVTAILRPGSCPHEPGMLT